MENKVFLSISINELEHLQREWIRDELQQYFANNPLMEQAAIAPEEPITANVLARMLHTTVENIHRQKAKGIIPYRKMGGRTYFLLSEVVDGMKKIQK